MMIVFFLAEDPEKGKIVDDSFGADGETAPRLLMSKAERQSRAESRAREVCRSFKLNYIDYDGPYSWLWRKPKWASQRPAGILEDKWAERLKSIDELHIYKAGIQTGRESKSKRGRKS
jgi:hypothetical protein